MTFHHSDGLEQLGYGVIRPAAMAEPERSWRHDGVKTVNVTVDVPATASPELRLFAGYNPRWVEPETNYGKGKPRAKLNPKKVRRIRGLISAGKNHTEIGRMMGVSGRTIGNVATGACWGWVE